MDIYESTPLPRQVKDRTGQRFGRLTVIRYAGLYKAPGGKTAGKWECLCDCGNTHIVVGTTLANGDTVSCGCFVIEAQRLSHVTHGMSHTKAYRCWGLMKDRCENPKGKHFPEYGGRGITVCEEWRQSFEIFLQDMGEPPSPTHTIERIDNDGPYSPTNCRWATRKEQARNTRRNVLYTYQGECLTLAEWAEKVNKPYKVLHHRISRGWTVEETLTIPLRIKIDGHYTQSPTTTKT